MPDARKAAYSVRPFKPTNAEYEAVAAINTALWPETPDDPDDIRRSDSYIDRNLVHGRLIAEYDGEIVAFCRYGQIERHQDPGACFVFVAVHPDRQRQRIATALYNRALAILERGALTCIRTHAREDFTGSMCFLAKLGYETIQREPESHLDVRNFDPRRFDRGLKGQDRSGVSIRTLRELQKTAPNWRRRCCDLEWELVCDMPGAEQRTRFVLERYVTVFDQPDFDPDAWFIAVDDDEWVAMSTIWSYSKTPRTFYTGITGVCRRYRRRGIATMLKLRVIEHVRNRGGHRIETTNEENNPMLEINKALGFVEAPAWLLLEKKI
ncbi:MAG: GNAT family N-acetyltransferase [Hyphomicrobiaceae bacterium]